MDDGLARIVARRRQGTERFNARGQDLGFELLDFWRWSASDLVENKARGILAEYLVARALGIDLPDVRDGWAAYDLCTSAGTKVEVKSAAYLQSWAQPRPSRITFRLGESKAWDPMTNTSEVVTKRQADVYVFAVLSHRVKRTLDPLDVGQWEFFVAPTAAINERVGRQRSISLASLRSFAQGPLSYHDLAGVVQ